MNPFTQRGRISDPRRFVGRWGELSVLFDHLTEGRPVLVTGMSAVGKSSLITHVAQSAAVNLERPELQGYYIDLAVLPDAATCYELMAKALGSLGNSAAAIEVALLDLEEPVAFCLDNADQAIAAGWGSELLDQLARVARYSVALRPSTGTTGTPASVAAAAQVVIEPLTAPIGAMAGTEFLLYLVVAVNGPPPALGERFARVGLGAFGTSEVRLLTDAYLDRTDVRFSPVELRELADISAGHPAYLQRAAYHLYESHVHPGYDWRAGYFAEAKNRPVPGAPLPPPIFDGERVDWVRANYGDEGVMLYGRAPQKLELSGGGEFVLLLFPLVVALLAWAISGQILISVGALLGAAVVALLVGRWLNRTPAEPVDTSDAQSADTPSQ